MSGGRRRRAGSGLLPKHTSLASPQSAAGSQVAPGPVWGSVAPGPDYPVSGSGATGRVTVLTRAVLAPEVKAGPGDLVECLKASSRVTVRTTAVLAPEPDGTVADGGAGGLHGEGRRCGPRARWSRIPVAGRLAVQATCAPSVLCAGRLRARRAGPVLSMGAVSMGAGHGRRRYPPTLGPEESTAGGPGCRAGRCKGGLRGGFVLTWRL